MSYFVHSLRCQPAEHCCQADTACSQPQVRVPEMLFSLMIMQLSPDCIFQSVWQLP
jgi:hypothetical protein